MGTIDGLLVTYLANALWMTCLVAAAAMFLARSIRRGPSRYRHALWIMALALASLLPLTSLRNSLNMVPGPSTLSAGGANANESSIGAPASSSSPLWFNMRHRRRPISFAPLLTQVLALGYLGFAISRGLVLCWAWRQTRRILRAASRRPLPLDHTVLVERCCAALHTRQARIACSHELRGPVVLGVWRPVLVLPEWFFSDISEEELVSALFHELAHVRRRDFLVNLICEVLLLPISFHPAAWLLKAQIKQSRELACDEIAAAKLPTRAAYARSLLSIARSIAATSSSPRSGYALGLFDSNTLEERIMNLFKKTNHLNKTWGRAQALTASCLLAAACLMASAFSIQVTRASGMLAEPRQFAGTWEGKFKGKTFITLKLVAKEGKISGTVSRISIQVNTKGELTDASSLDGEDAISETIPDANVLHLTTKAKGEVSTMTGDSEESIQYDMKLTGADQAELQIAGIPPGMPAPAPWKLERKPATP